MAKGIGGYIKEQRKGSNLTQDGLANRLGVSRQTVAMWEQSRRYPTTEHIEKMGEVFGEPVLVVLPPVAELVDGVVVAAATRRIPRPVAIAIAGLAAILLVGATYSPAAAKSIPAAFMYVPSAIISVFSSGPSIDALVASAYQHKVAREWDDALVKMDNILDKDPSRTDIMAERAVVLKALERNDDSIAGFWDTLAGDPSPYYSGLSKFNLGEMTGEAEHFLCSIVDMTVATQGADADNPDSWLVLGMAYRQLWRLDTGDKSLLVRSEQNILQANLIDPFYPDVLVELEYTRSLMR